MTQDQQSGILIDSFINQYGTYSIYYNDNAEAISVGFTGENESILVTETERQRGYGELITSRGSANNPGTTIYFYAMLTTPFVYTESIADAPAASGCDVAITGITINNPAQAGVNNGGITISATSGRPPMLYSVDNLNWSILSTFSSLPGGGGTAYVRDDADCIALQTYYIPTNTPQPDRLIVKPVLGPSRWAALFNPIVFGYQSPVHAPGRKFVTEITAIVNGQTKVFSATHSANLTGYCRADISKYLRTLVQPKDDFDYSVLNYRDPNISASYTIRYQEVWDGGQTDWFTIAEPFYCTYSAMQVGNKTGGNMLPYVTFAEARQPSPAKFMTDFKQPAFYTDMPFDLSFIYSEQLNGKQISVQGNGIDINGEICGKFGELNLLNENGLALKTEDGAFLLTDKQQPGSLSSAIGVNRLCFNKNTHNIPANSHYLDIWLYYVDGSGYEVPVTETKRLKLDSAPTNALPYEYLKWMGPTGGWNYYMLVKNQIHEMATRNAVLMERYIDDYAAADSTQQLISITAQKRITAGKNDIPAHEAEALATILYSPKVYRLVDAATNTWQGVIMDTQSLKLYQTYGRLGDFEISYLLPEVNVQRA
jgi:hypothetical protein